MQRYYFDQNTYKTVNVKQTDSAGQVYFDVELEEEKYKFLVQKPFGETVYVSNGFYIEATSLNLFVSVTEDTGKEYLEQQSIDYDGFYDKNESEFSVSYTDSQGVASEFCLEIYTQGQFGAKEIDSACSDSNSGTIELTHPDDDKTYYAQFSGNIDGKKQIITTLYPKTDGFQMGKSNFSLLMAALIVIFGALLSPISIIALLLSTVALIFVKLLGLIALSWWVVITMVIGGFVVAIILNMMRR